MIELSKQKDLNIKERKNDIKRNVNIDYIFCFMENFNISSAI